MLRLEDLLETGRTDGVAADGEDFGKAIEGVETVDAYRTVKEFRLHFGL